MEKLTEASGYAIYRKGAEGEFLVIVNQRLAWTYTTKFVLALLTVIFIAAGIVLVNQDASLLGITIMLLIFGIVTGILCITLFKAVNKWKAYRERDKVICIIDTNKHLLLDENGKKVLAELKDCRLIKQFQLTSSSPAYVITSPQGNMTIIKGHPFGGGTKEFMNKFESFDLL